MNYTLKYIKTEGGFVGYLLEIPGVCSQGDSIEELRDNIKDALQCMFEVIKKDGIMFPNDDWDNSILETIEI